MTDSEGPLGHACPECGAPRRPDRSPSCDCTARAAEALHETRTAEAAAAEDFDPLRIRPYVDFEDSLTTPQAPGTSDETGPSPTAEGNAEPARGRAEKAGRGAGDEADGTGNAGVRAKNPGGGAYDPADRAGGAGDGIGNARGRAKNAGHGTGNTADRAGGAGHGTENAADRAKDAGHGTEPAEGRATNARDGHGDPTDPAENAGHGTEPAGNRAKSARDGAGNAVYGARGAGDRTAGTGVRPHIEGPRLPDAAERQPGGAGPDVRPRPRSARRAVLLSAAGAGVAVVAAAGLASGLLSYRPPTRDRTVQEVRESVPDVRRSTPASPTAPSSPAPPYSAAPTAQSPSPRPASPSAKPSAPPSPTGSAAGTTHPASPTPRSTSSATPVLQLGDRGPEVAELQQRLRQLNLYGDQITGVFTRPVEDAVRNYQLARGVRGDTLGVYGPATRKSLEAETSEP